MSEYSPGSFVDGLSLVSNLVSRQGMASKSEPALFVESFKPLVPHCHIISSHLPIELLYSLSLYTISLANFSIFKFS